MREIETHKVNCVNNDVNKCILLIAMDTLTDGANSAYKAVWNDTEMIIPFQNGPIVSDTVHGLTDEVLLTIVADRLEGFQRGPYICAENSIALFYVQSALNALKARIIQRATRGRDGVR
jgi:hypothetical protein